MVVLKCGAIARVDMAITAGQTRTIDLALFADIARRTRNVARGNGIAS